MRYIELCKVYKELEENPSRLKKTEILSEFLSGLKKEKNKEEIYLVEGKILPDYDTREIGISTQLAIKALAKSTGMPEKDIVSQWKKIGDLGLVSESLIQKKKQSTLSTHELTTEKVLENLKKLLSLQGKGAVEKKMSLISELLTSSKPIEAKYIIRTLLQDLRIGVGEGVLRDAIVWACLDKEDKNSYVKVQEAYDSSTDFAETFKRACKGKKELEETELTPGKPLKVMLALKAESIKDGFEKVGIPCAVEYKYDGFRMLISKHNDEIKIFTRRLENVTKQFPEVPDYIKKYVKASSFIIDSEAVGYDPKTKKYKPFQEISQRIKRKYDIEKLEKELPVEINVFDVLYYEGKSLLQKPFQERRKLLEKIITEKKYNLVLAKQIITSSEKEAEEFYEKALKEGEEGIMIKALNAPYKPGARVGHMLKFKPSSNELDLVIIKAEFGTGKRGGWLTSYTVACRGKNNELLEIGKVSTGLKEKSEQGLSFEDMTKKLKKIITKEHGREVEVKPEIIITVKYQNIQKSPSYSSGFALRFPRFTAIRPDRSIKDIATIEEVERDSEKGWKWRVV